MKVSRCLYCEGKNLIHVTHRVDNIGILECQNCHVMMVDRISDNTAGLYTKEYFEKKDASSKYGYSTYMSSATADIIGKYGFARLFSDGLHHLDLGSADGSLMEVFDQERFSTRGLEISSDAVDVTHKKGLSATVSNLHKFPKDIKNINIVTAYDLLEHADKPGLVLRNVYQSLAEDGVFVFSTLSVKHRDPSDFWFNHSLEHYVYYDENSLAGILEDVFGVGNYGFVEMEINGVAEFWGFAAKKMSAERGRKAIEIIKDNSSPINHEQAYHLSLFYNQVSEFNKSEKIIHEYHNLWPISMYTEALFYNNYIQGKLEKALKLTDSLKIFVPSSRGVFWRGYYQAEKVFSGVLRKQQEETNNQETIRLQEVIFKLNEEIHNLRDSRIVGRIIKLRDKLVGHLYPKLKHSPRWAIGKIKNFIGFFLPMEVKVKIGSYKRALKARALNTNRHVSTQEIQVRNERLGHGEPLVSVVIPYYNRAETIDDTLTSLTNQTFTDFEVIIVDDGSTDKESIQKLKEVNRDFNTLSIQVVHQANGGVSKARNKGISISKGKYIICLDSDDCLVEVYLEECLLALESDPNASIVTTYRQDFGVRNGVYIAPDYDATRLLNDNMVTTAAMYRKSAWLKTEGYKSNIGYEDWEYWITLAENGDWGRTIREPLFKYRVAMQSRFMDDKSVHWNNLKAIKKLHTGYKSKINMQQRMKAAKKKVVTQDTFLVNLSNSNMYRKSDKPSILIAIPWMTFGGAETLIYNFCQGLKDRYDITFVTGLTSDHEWEYKFREISDKIYHLPELFLSRSELYEPFLENYINVHDIRVLHIIHTGYVFDMLPTLKERVPNLSVAVTMFNDRVPEYVEKSIEYKEYIDAFNTDSAAVAKSFSNMMGNVSVQVIPNGIDCVNQFNPNQFNRDSIRKELGVTDEITIFFVGRLSEEKNPDIFIKATDKVASKMNIRAFVIGDGPMKKECETLIKDLRSGRVLYLGYKADIARYLSAADVFILPSRIEGFPLSILEAMAMGVAVVASNVGAIPDVIVDGKNGFIVNPGSIDDIVIAVEKLSKKGVLDQIRKNNILKVKRNYSRDQVASRYSDLYRGLLK